MFRQAHNNTQTNFVFYDIYYHVVTNFSPFPPQALQSIVALNFQHDPPPILPITSLCMPVSYFHYLKVLLNLISPSFLWSSLFLIPFILEVTILGGFFCYSSL